MQQTLHIALCDTNFADRKQMERLLTRESDKRLSTCVFYMETFGSRDALLDNPRVYDAYFLDLADTSYSAYDLAKEIQAKGILSPIIFCSSTINYRECGDLLPNSVFLDKPIQVKELSLILDEIIIQKREQYIPTVELRNATEVFYLTEKEIVYCEEKTKARKLLIHTSDGGIKEAEGSILNLYTELIPMDHFFVANKNVLANARYVKDLTLLHVILDDGTSLRLTHTGKKEVLDKKKRANM